MGTVLNQGLPVLQIQAQTTYSTLCEVYDEFSANEKALTAVFNAEVKKNRSMYDAYSKADHSDIGLHLHVFDEIDFGCGYSGHVGVPWPLKSPRLVKALSKDFTLQDKHSCIEMTAAYILPLDVDERLFVFFTRFSIEAWLDSTKLARSFLFFHHCDKGYISFCGVECRLISHMGMSYGHKPCRFCVFDEFSDSTSCPPRMTQRNKDMLFDVVWNGCDWDY